MEHTGTCQLRGEPRKTFSWSCDWTSVPGRALLVRARPPGLFSVAEKRFRRVIEEIEDDYSIWEARVPDGR